MSKVLIVVDMQNDFVTGVLGTPEAQAIVPNVENKIRNYISNDQLLYFTRDTHWDDYMETQEGQKLPVPHCIMGSNGWNIIPELHGYEKYADMKCLNKKAFGYDYWEEVFGTGSGIESIELVGVCTDICVVSNALILKALYPEIPITVDASCCAGTTLENHKAALQVMKCCQINVIGE